MNFNEIVQQIKNDPRKIDWDNLDNKIYVKLLLSGHHVNLDQMCAGKFSVENVELPKNELFYQLIDWGHLRFINILMCINEYNIKYFRKYASSLTRDIEKTFTSSLLKRQPGLIHKIDINNITDLSICAVLQDRPDYIEYLNSTRIQDIGELEWSLLIKERSELAQYRKPKYLYD